MKEKVGENQHKYLRDLFDYSAGQTLAKGEQEKKRIVCKEPQPSFEKVLVRSGQWGVQSRSRACLLEKSPLGKNGLLVPSD